MTEKELRMMDICYNPNLAGDEIERLEKERDALQAQLNDLIPPVKELVRLFPGLLEPFKKGLRR